MSTYDTTPGPHFLLAMQNQKWTVSGALAELIDNSFGAARGNAKQCEITYDTRHRRLVVIDDGRGMDAVGRLFKLGDTIGRSPGDIGMYGAGGTMALLWLAKRVQVWTLRKGKVNHADIDWKQAIAAQRFPQVPNDWELASLGNTPSELLDLRHGTMMRIELQDERSIGGSALSNVQRELAELYGPALRKGKTIVWETKGKNGGRRVLADEELELTDVHVLAGAVEVERDGNVEHLSYRGRIGFVEGLPLSKNFVSIGYGIRRIMQTRECFNSEDHGESYSGSGVRGHIDLGDDWQPFLSTTKDDINDRRVWKALMSSVFAEIQPLLKRIEEDKHAILFDDLAVQLQAAFDGKATVDVFSGVKPGGTKPWPGPGPGPGPGPKPPGPGPNPWPIVDNDVEEKKPTPAATKITIVQEDDDYLEGSLSAFIETGVSQYAVYVNKEHRDVQAALQARPTNRLALLLLITSEIAAQALVNPKIQAALLKPSDIARVDSSSVSKHSLLCRILMDRILRPTEKVAK